MSASGRHGEGDHAKQFGGQRNDFSRLAFEKQRGERRGGHVENDAGDDHHGGGDRAGHDDAAAGTDEVAGAEILAGHRGGGNLERAARHVAQRLDLDRDAVCGGGNVAQRQDDPQVNQVADADEQHVDAAGDADAEDAADEVEVGPHGGEPQMEAGPAAGEQRQENRRAAAVADGRAERDAGPAQFGQRADAAAERVARRPC